MIPQELIRHKRDGGEFTQAELEFLVDGLTSGTLSDAQVGALAMAIFFNGLNDSERVIFTRAMTHSGTVLDWSGIGKPILDKHSTGGVGDKVSLILAPIVAACGGAVPMLSGRGLGHTGGTLDKLESIPGYVTQPSLERFQSVVGEVGCAIIGQTPELAPADRRLYAIRDATGTVESIPLIVASILSKKIASGLDGLVLDVKTGTGAFMSTHERSVELADALVEVATGNGLACSALLTDMNQVLGRTAGNAVEVLESIELLTGSNPDERLSEVTLALSAELLVLGGLAADSDVGMTMAAEALHSGAAAEYFSAMVVALGGPEDLVENPGKHLPAAPVTVMVRPTQAGFVQEIDVRQIGITVLELGGGRRTEKDPIDHAVGLTEFVARGEEVGSDRSLAVVHANTAAAAERAVEQIRRAVRVGSEMPAQSPLFELASA